MKEKAKRFLRGFVVLGNIVFTIILSIVFIKATLRDMGLYNEIDPGEAGLFLLIIGWITINTIALCDMPTLKDSWLSLTLKRRKLEQQAKIKDLEEHLKEPDNKR